MNILVCAGDIIVFYFRSEKNVAEFSFYKVPSFWNIKSCCSRCNIENDFLDLYTVSLDLKKSENLTLVSFNDELLDKILCPKVCSVCYTDVINGEEQVHFKRRKCVPTINIEEELIRLLKQDVGDLKTNVIVEEDADQACRSLSCIDEDLEVLSISDQ